MTMDTLDIVINLKKRKNKMTRIFKRYKNRYKKLYITKYIKEWTDYFLQQILLKEDIPKRFYTIYDYKVGENTIDGIIYHHCPKDFIIEDRDDFDSSYPTRKDLRKLREYAKEMDNLKRENAYLITHGAYADKYHSFWLPLEDFLKSDEFFLTKEDAEEEIKLLQEYKETNI